MSDLQNRVAVMERSLQRLNDVLKGHLTPCVDNHSSGSAMLPHRDVSPLADSSADQTHTRVTGLEEPQDEDAATNGMAMTFVEENTSAFFGESSNINFTQLLLRALGTIRHSEGMLGISDSFSVVEGGDTANLSHGQSPANVTASASLDYQSLFSQPSRRWIVCWTYNSIRLA